MMEWLKAIYGAVGAQHPLMAQILAVVIGGILFGGGWWVIGKEYRNAHPEASATAPVDPASRLQQRAWVIVGQISIDQDFNVAGNNKVSSYRKKYRSYSSD